VRQLAAAFPVQAFSVSGSPLLLQDLNGERETQGGSKEAVSKSVNGAGFQPLSFFCFIPGAPPQTSEVFCQTFFYPRSRLAGMTTNPAAFV
jgi:hypothetical protein